MPSTHASTNNISNLWKYIHTGQDRYGFPWKMYGILKASTRELAELKAQNRIHPGVTVTNSKIFAFDDVELVEFLIWKDAKTSHPDAGIECIVRTENGAHWLANYDDSDGTWTDSADNTIICRVTHWADDFEYPIPGIDYEA